MQFSQLRINCSVCLNINCLSRGSSVINFGLFANDWVQADLALCQHKSPRISMKSNQRKHQKPLCFHTIPDRRPCFNMLHWTHTRVNNFNRKHTYQHSSVYWRCIDSPVLTCIYRVKPRCPVRACLSLHISTAVFCCLLLSTRQEQNVTAVVLSATTLSLNVEECEKTLFGCRKLPTHAS